MLVFQNAVDFNEPHVADSEYAQMVVPRCKHMVRYVKWLCLESLPLLDDTTGEAAAAQDSESQPILRK